LEPQRRKLMEIRYKLEQTYVKWRSGWTSPEEAKERNPSRGSVLGKEGQSGCFSEMRKE